MNKNILWITRTAIFTSLLVVAQLLTAGFGNTLITGSLVNLLLILSVCLCGFSSGVTVGVLSPVVARFLGIGPLWVLIPFIILGNLTLVTVWKVTQQMAGEKKSTGRIMAVLLSSFAKFAVLFLGVVKIALPLLGLPGPQVAVISTMFSFPQLATALIGGTMALLLLPLLENALKSTGRIQTQ